ncbi:hypothetical protein Tco_0638858, partial [Tanacetum coccineum]
IQSVPPLAWVLPARVDLAGAALVS